MSSDVIATERISQLDAAVCAVVFQADLAEGFRAGYGCNFTWETNGECDFAGDGFAWAAAFSELLPSAESGLV